MMFTIKALGSGDITWSLNDKTLQYQKNGGQWQTMDSGVTLSVVDGDEIRFKGTNTGYCGNTISSTAQIMAMGNIMSLTDGNNFESANTLQTTKVFQSLFSGCQNLMSVEDLKLPVTALTESCYSSMFSRCGFSVAPELPATSLAYGCYAYMFQMCPNLTQAPELPAMTLAQSCYARMFNGCTSLETAPDLLAISLPSSAYQYMFDGCTKLNYVKALFTTSPSTGNCTQYWLRNVSSTGTFVKNSSATWTTSGYNGVPSGWTIQTVTP